jgi:hypothetical protein
MWKCVFGNGWQFVHNKEWTPHGHFQSMFGNGRVCKLQNFGRIEVSNIPNNRGNRWGVV